MLNRQSGSYTMEALALVAALFIIAIFIFSDFQREADAQDAQARRFAQTLQPKVEAFFQAQPEADLTPEALKSQGVEIPAPLQMDIPLDNRKASDWQVRVWHTDGRMQYIVSAGGVEQDYR
jgi:hypothetical protein